MIFSIDSFRAAIHATSMITAIITAAKYSILQCQKGCSLSGFLFESLIQIIVTKEEITSLKLFTASKTIAIEFAKNQTIDLKTTKAILVSIPYKLTLIICLSLFIIFY
ncbi:hypothetical protein J6V86_02890 [bacterium]|nr:hypothetical protein [bacterium]